MRWTKYSKKRWESFKTAEGLADRIDVYRLEPQICKGRKINGFLLTLSKTTSIDEIWKTTVKDHGGGMYVVKLAGVDGRVIAHKIMCIAGLPCFPCDCPIIKLMNRGCKDEFHR